MFTGTDYVNNFCSVKKTYNHSVRRWLKHFKIFDFSPGEKRVKTCEQPPPPRTACKPRRNLSAHPPSLLPAEATRQEAQGHLSSRCRACQGPVRPLSEATVPSRAHAHGPTQNPRGEAGKGRALEFSQVSGMISSRTSWVKSS